VECVGGFADWASAAVAVVEVDAVVKFAAFQGGFSLVAGAAKWLAFGEFSFTIWCRAHPDSPVGRVRNWDDVVQFNVFGRTADGAGFVREPEVFQRFGLGASADCFTFSGWFAGHV